MSDLGYRPLGFESDLNNQNFAGAVNPDALLHVEFFWHTPLDKNKSEEESERQNRPVRIYGEKQIYVRILAPGDQTSMIETPVREDHKRRFPEKWLYFQIQEGLIDGGANQPGWKLEEWGELTTEEIHRLKFLRFYTVEQIAGANDAQVNGIGMGGLGLREKAKASLKARATQEVRAELEAKDKQIAGMAEQLAKLTAIVMGEAKPPVQQVPDAPAAVPAEKPAKRGKKKKRKSSYVMTPEHKAKVLAALKAAREAKQKAQGG